ncbi:MAG: EAL domain-containing protein [Hamadaea sp.]|uniref:putative bifunctional diguanylate cyclase/phosphodiesterase n=1 Tax=Hamadaea sp. TaxID=2024425 RepID=UPI00180A7A53|nr:EAL domain-containing protein [Hamadaea sp.]NUR72537.1 EAL domain-containing protein [Hamadaea sp.]NUT22913.1 EAL domain-containing protein [Hamadaea sp.]
MLYPTVMIGLIIAYYLIPPFQTTALVLVGLGGASAILIGVRRHRTDRWLAWVLLAAGIVMISLGEAVYGIQGDARSFPGAPELLFVAAYVPLALGLILMGRPRTLSSDLMLILDTIAVGLAATLVVWITLVRPAVLSLHLSGYAKYIVIAGNVGYAAVLASAALVAVAWRANAALRVLGVGLVAFLIADYVYGTEIIAGTWTPGGLADLGFPIFFALSGAAALMPSMSEVASRTHARNMLGARLVMVAIGLLVAPTVLLVAATSGPVTTGLAIALTAVAIGIVMITRIYLSARAYQQKALRESSLRMASRALMLATDRRQIEAGVTAALRQLVPTATVAITEPGGPVPEGLALKLQGGEPPCALGKIVFRGPTARLDELTPTLQALADQAASAYSRVRTVEELAAEQREQYFRTLVQTSTDVTLISRQGVIEYATPSAHVLFGLEVVGANLDDLVARRGGAGWPDTVEAEEGEVHRDGRSLAVLVHRRDLASDPTVAGVVTTLRDVTAERDLRRDLAHQASHDVITGLGNPRLFRHALAEAVRTPGAAVLLLDIDDFKLVNDTYGHPIGDQLLVASARRIESVIGPADLAARIGGDEFGVVLGDCTDVGVARDVAQRLADLLAEQIEVEDMVIECRASIGLAHAANTEDDSLLMRQADMALYAAKSGGKGRWRQYDGEMSIPARNHAEVGRRLRSAMASGELILVYQPIVDLVTGETAGLEALLRLEDDGDHMPPPQIIAAAESTGLIGQLGEWILDRALADLPSFQLPDRDPCYVSVNVSARQLRRSDFTATVRRALKSSRADPRLLVLEVTENILIENDDERPWAYLDELHELGVRIAIDDYGTGYASLGYLRQDSVDIVKIDRSMLSDLTPRAKRLIEGVSATLRRIGVDQIAEGVETDHARAVLVDAGCPYGQGFLFSPPMPLDEAVRWLRSPAVTAGS